ncbi:MAG: CHAT domain-containing protein [Myxococcota bacterium]
MVDPHEQLGPFLDGELSAEDAAAFERHLASCPQCQQDLRDFSAIDAVTPGTKPAAARPGPSARGRFLAPLALAATTVLSIGGWLALRAPETASPVALAANRPFEARITWPVADAWRPYEPSRAAGLQTEPLAAATLATLEQAGDRRALASAWLLSGSSVRAREALEALARSPEVLSDLAAVALVEGRDEEALALAQDALDLSPQLPQAAWNRALALERLQLPRVAAEAFRKLGALDPAGWGAEARRRAEALDAAWSERVRRTQEALDAGATMVLEGRPMPATAVRAMPSWARMNFRYALLGAATADEVRGLEPVARELDALFGGDAAMKALERHAALDPRQRTGFAPRFRRLMIDYYLALRGTGYAPSLPGAPQGLGAEAAAFVQELRRAKALPWLVFAAPMGRQLDAAWKDYVAAVQADGDPWLPFAVELEEARRFGAAGDAAKQEERLIELLVRARQGRATHRALQALEQLTALYTGQHRVVEAATTGREAMQLARDQGELAAELRLLHVLADAARFRNAAALSIALLEERTLRLPADCDAQAYVGESLASLKLVSLEPVAARAALDAVKPCTTPLSVVGVGVLSELLRLDPRPGDAARFEEAVAALRGTALGPSEEMLLEHIEGRAWIDRDAVRGTAKLRAALAAAKEASDADAAPKKVWAHGFGLLRTAAGEAGQWGTLFSLTAEELGREMPRRCALIVDVQDNRVVAAARDASGSESGRAHRFPFGERRPDGLRLEELSTVVGPLARGVAGGCEQLAVFASYPLHGRSGWLPDDVAWSYAGGAKAGAASAGGRSLVVHDVSTPPSLRLPRVGRWVDVPREGDEELTGSAATPGRVLEAMRTASFVELHAHGLVNPAQADTAALVLAPDAQGHFSLSATELRSAKLEAAPVVVLAACHASSVAPYLHEPWSLPRAFLIAGARAVIAAPVELPDAEARDFFRALTARLRSGQSPATAVRDERIRFLAAQPRASWVRSVLVFD